MLRAMFLEFPDDPGCAYLDLQYMLGDSLLVAPVFSTDNTVNFYVPAGRWTNILNGEIIEGPRWVQEQHDYFSLPLLARPNTIIPIGANEQRPDYDYTQDITFHIFELADGVVLTYQVPALDGAAAMRMTVRRLGSEIEIATDPPGVSTGETPEPSSWSVILRGQVSIESAEGCKVDMLDAGARLTPNPGSYTLRCRLGD